MRVVHIIKAKQIGGAERHLLILLPALRKRGVDAHLLMIVEPDNMMTNMMDEALALDIPVQRIVIYGNTDPLIITRIRSVLKELKPDVVHTHLIHADIFGVIAAKLAGVKTIITGRHNDDDFRHKRVVFWLNRLIWRLVQGGIAISDAIEQFMLIVEKAPPEKLRVVTYGIPHVSPQPDDLNAAKKSLRAEQNLPEDTLLIGMACRLVEQKGIIYALRAFAQIADEFPTLHFILAGEGNLQGYLETETRNLNLTGRVHFIGWVEDATQVMAGLDVFLVPSLWEGFGLVLLEAMSVRVPIIASRVSAIPEVIEHGETGILVPPRDVDAIADALRVLLPDELLRKHLALVAEDRLERLFSADAMAERTIKVYEEFQR